MRVDSAHRVFLWPLVSIPKQPPRSWPTLNQSAQSELDTVKRAQDYLIPGRHHDQGQRSKLAFHPRFTYTFSPLCAHFQTHFSSLSSPSPLIPTLKSTNPAMPPYGSPHHSRAPSH